MYDDGDEAAATTPDHDGLVARMTAFAEGMPITAVLAPFRSGGVVVGVELTDLFADDPGKGFGSTYMTRLVDEAEACDVALYLRPDSRRAKAFYERFGFERTSLLHGGLARLPPAPDWAMRP